MGHKVCLFLLFLLPVVPLSPLLRAETVPMPETAMLPEAEMPKVSKARWIWHLCTRVMPRSGTALRTTVELDGPVKDSFIYAAFDDRGKIFVNGRELTCTPFDPEKDDRFIRRYDIPAGYWRQGKNVISADVFNQGGIGGAMVRGEITLVSGRKVPVFTSDRWRAMPQPEGEQWHKPEFDDSRWGTAMELGDVLVHPWYGACHQILDLMLDEEEKQSYRRNLETRFANIDFLKNLPEPDVSLVRKDGLTGIKINGEVVPPILYIAGGSTWAPHNADAIAKVNRAGVKLIAVHVNASDLMIAPGKYDFSRFGDSVRRAVALAPDAWFSLGIGIHFPHSPQWHKRFPEALIGYPTGPADSTGNQLARFRSPSMADPLTYAEVQAYAGQFMSYIKKQPWYKKIVMIRVSHGVTAEWHYYGMEKDMPDTSQPMTDAFRRYLRKKYASDRALQQAWHDNGVTFATAQVPGIAARIGHGRFLRDPASPDRAVLDYYDCMQNVIADLLLHFTGCIKKADPKMLTGAYYGYLYHMTFPPEGQIIRLEKVLSHPSVDFLSQPHSYSGYSRAVGGDAMARTVFDPFRKYGKLLLYEADTRTHIAGMDVPVSGKCRNAVESSALLRHQMAKSFIDGGGVQFLEFAARNGTMGWFNDPLLYRDMRNAGKLWQELWQRCGKVPANRIAVVISPEELVRQGYPRRPEQVASIPNILDRPVQMLFRSGVCFDHMTLQGFLESDTDYQAVVLLNVLSPSAEERQMLLKKLRRPGVTAIWGYAPGLVTEQGFSEAAMSELCGITLKARFERLPMAVTTRSGVKLRAAIGRKLWAENPRCHAEDPAAEILGTYDDDRSGAVAFKHLADGSNAVFCGMPVNDPVFWRELWQKIGIPTVTDDPALIVSGNDRLLVAHTGKAGDHTLRVPAGTTKVRELFTGREFRVKDGRIKLSTPHAESWFLIFGK